MHLLLFSPGTLLHSCQPNELSKYDYTIVHNGKPAVVADSAALANITSPVTAKITNGQIPGDQTEEG